MEFLRCKISQGLFSGEVAVQGDSSDIGAFSLFVAGELVKYACEPRDDAPVDGWLQVDVIASDADHLLVRLPGQAFENGQMVTVDRSQVRHSLALEPV
ncbi:MAG: hypothetical protein NTY19_12510 [Planctomycetota bacterium]|nr:hypothetical protein [Planctomycetota bacterium]